MEENHHSPLVLTLIGFLLFGSPAIFDSACGGAPPIAGDGGKPAGDNADMQKVYIIRVRPPANLAAFEEPAGMERWYKTFLPPIATNSTDSRFIHAYIEVLTGFAARLTDAELAYIKQKEGFVRAFPDRSLTLATTHTPAFLGLHPGGGPWSGSNMGKGVIIGVVDTGIKLDHPSFYDQGMEAPPSKWKGTCKFPGCNKKVVGARTIISGKASSTTQVDEHGHGTHTSSTAAGNFVRGANVLGSGNGTAAGMAPRAHLAMYKVCSFSDCLESDLVAGIDAAIKDGVDILSISIAREPRNFYDDPTAISAFAATAKGIFVSCAAGNQGPAVGVISNAAPWILTVGAGTTDRNLRATVKLGDGQELNGETAYQPRHESSRMLPLVFAGSNLPGCDSTGLGTPTDQIKGKMVVCLLSTTDDALRIKIGQWVKQAGGAAVLFLNTDYFGYTTFAQPHVLPAAHLSYADGLRIAKYMNTSKNPEATIIFMGTVLGVSPCPVVASFSSRGPGLRNSLILKPDIIGPGVNVIAAWPSGVGPQPSSPTFNILSGTSMSTPHLSGVAALIKRAHPRWSPAAIKSAMITTSYIRGRDGKLIEDEFHYPAPFITMGAGHIDPVKAIDPGLIFDLDASDYIPYLCGLGYTDEEVEHVTRRSTSCASLKKIDGSELNYPSLYVDKELGTKTVRRTATNVGMANSTYTAKIEVIRGNFSMNVTPARLRFSQMNQKRSFVVRMSWGKDVGLTEGNILWVSGKFSVRIPVVIYWV